MAQPTMKDISLLIQAGIDPKTGLPYKFGNKKATKVDIKKFLRIIDEQDAVNRYTWYNLPCDLTSQELERLLYYKGQLCLFYYKEADKFYIMPYALDGTIDFYGRFNTIHPVPMTSGTDADSPEMKKQFERVRSLLSNLKLKCVYGLKNEVVEEDLYNSAVLLYDYSKQLSQLIIPRANVNDSLLDAMAECVPMMRTALLASTGVRGIRVADADSAANVKDASDSLESAAMNGEPYYPIVSKVEMQDLASNPTSKAEEYMLAMQSLDNLRLSGYGIDNGGLFEKKAHTLQSEADVNGGPVGLVLQDGLDIRRNFCMIANSIWGTNIWVEVNENVSGADLDGDGVLYNENEGEQTGVETETEEGGEDNA